MSSAQPFTYSRCWPERQLAYAQAHNQSGDMVSATNVASAALRACIARL